MKQKLFLLKREEANRSPIPALEIPPTVCMYSCYMKNFFVYVAVHCSALQAPDNGHITPDSCLTNPTYGTMCHFTCEKGYQLDGEPIAFCLSKGQWSLKTNVFCKG